MINRATQLIRNAKLDHSAKVFDPSFPSKILWKKFSNLGYKDDAYDIDIKFKAEDENNFCIDKVNNYPPGNRHP